MSSNLVYATVSDGDLFQSRETLPLPWWSFTKTCIAAASLSLVAAGKLSLDETLEGKPYTLRQLLQHRAGVPEYCALKSYHPAVLSEQVPWSADEMLRRVKADQLIYSPGEGWAYSNTGYCIVRRLLEQTVGASLNEILQQFVFTPLGVSGVALASSPEELSHVAYEGKKYYPGWVYHGLLIGTPAQAALVLHGILTGSLLPAALLSEMMTPFQLEVSTEGRPWHDPGYGLGLMTGNCKKGRVYGHTGQGPGSTIAVYHFSDLKPAKTVATFQPVMTQGLVETEAVSIA